MKTTILVLLSLILISCYPTRNILGPGTSPPNKPSNPTPSDNATSVSVDTNLQWQCPLPDGYDPSFQVSYKVYFGTSPDPPMVHYYYEDTWYRLGTLNYGTTYYWKITSYFIGKYTHGDIWMFTTEENQTNNLPTNPSSSNNEIFASKSTDL